MINPADVTKDAFVFATGTGGRMNPSNFRKRILKRARQKASERLMNDGYGQLPHLTPHSCRRTFCSWLYALGATPDEVMAEMGHETTQLALAVYVQARRRSKEESSGPGP